MIAAVEEERFRRVKHWAGFPQESIRACLKMAGVAPTDIDHVAISRDPHAHLPRKVWFALCHRPTLRLVATRLTNAQRIRRLATRLSETLGLDPRRTAARIHWVEHHPAHLASAFFVSPFEEAAVCAIDGFGDFVSTSQAIGRGSALQLLHRVYFPHSLGMLYLALTQYLGFLDYGDEYKVMGLAAYGQPDYAAHLRRLVSLQPDGSFVLDLAYFRHHAEGLNMTWEDGAPTIGQVYTAKLETLLGPARRPDELILPRHEAIAASLQLVFEEAVLHLLNALHRATRLPRLCLAGGCAMNSVLNGKIRAQTPFKELFIQPAAADNGTALGAASYVQHQILKQPRTFVMEHAYWGPAFPAEALGRWVAEQSGALTRRQCRLTHLPDEEQLCGVVAERLATGKIIGWFQGRMEWGPRALGNRSILADPRRPEMREVLNTKIKFRERFRPFAPVILEEALPDYFLGAVPDPFMIQVYPVRSEQRAAIPAVTHVDGSGRLQTVNRAQNPLLWRLLKAFQQRTGVPILLNTSFNENEPIVHTPAEALDCFLRTGMDILVVGTHIMEKGEG